MTNQKNILISACLLGQPVRYNGSVLLIDHPLIQKWQKEGCLIAICPELAGGMSVPRAPAEITKDDGCAVLSGDSEVIDIRGNNVTDAFVLGANRALALALENNCTIAILTERSPSCGSSLIYDGSFSSTRKQGEGVTTALLKQHNIQVFNQEQLELVEKR